MGKVTPELLANCLDDQRPRQSVPVEDPVTAAELHALLDVARSITPPPPVEPNAAFRSRGRAALIAAIASEQERKGRSPFRGLWQAFGVRWTPWWAPQPVLTATVVLALTLATGSGIVSAAQDTLPGDVLYPVKTTVESAQLALAANDEAKVQVYLDLAGRRLAEVEQASQHGRSDAARDAAEAFVQQVAKADQQLSEAAAKGNDVTSLQAKLTEKLVRHQAVLARVQDRAPEAAKPALARAAEAAQKGLTNASTHAGGVAASQESDGESASTHQNGHTPPKGGAKQQPGATNNDAQLSVEAEGAAADLAETIADVEALAAATGDETSGQSVNGLIAKLNAAKAAIDRGQNEVAVHHLDAFHEQLNAMEQSGHLSADAYQQLRDRYRELVARLGDTPKEKPTTTDGRLAPDRKQDPPSNPGKGGEAPGHQSGSSKGKPDR